MCVYLGLEALHQDGHQQVKQDVVSKGHESDKVEGSHRRGGGHAVIQNLVPVLLGQDLERGGERVETRREGERERGQGERGRQSGESERGRERVEEGSEGEEERTRRGRERQEGSGNHVGGE